MNKELYRIIGYEFKNENLIEVALTHKSIHNDVGLKYHDNERLEFIGDAFLDVVVGLELFKRLPNATEGELTKKRSLVVCEKSLASLARKLGINNFMIFGHQAISSGVMHKDSVLADCIEAIIGAVYLDSNYETASNFIIKNLSDTLEDAINDELFSDYKSELQEYFQGLNRKMNLKYIVDEEKGPDHDKTFIIHVEENGQKFGKGIGKSKKEAEQNAARESLLYLNNKEK